MKTKSICLLILALFSFVYVSSQINDPAKNKKVDSLNNALKFAKQDSAILKLKYDIGIVCQIKRVGYWDSLRELAQKHNMPLYICKCLNSLGISSYYQGNLPKAIEYGNQSLAIATTKGFKKELMKIYSVLGSYYGIENNLRKALDCYFKALKFAEELKDLDNTQKIKLEIATRYFFLEEYEKALEIHLNCLKVARENNIQSEIAFILNDIGSDYAGLKDTANTIRYYFESATYAKNVNHIELIQIYNSVGSSYDMMQKHDSAQLYFNKAYRLALSENYKYGMASSLAVLAICNLHTGNISKAKKQALEGYEIARAVRFTAQIPSIANTLKDIYLKENHHKKALEFYTVYVNVKDSLMNEKNYALVSQKAFDYEFEKKENENKLLAQKNQIQALELRQNNYFLCGMLALLLLVCIIAYLFIRQNKLKAQQQNIRMEQKLLLSQMNPHFIFNSLQAIQNFILKNDEKREAIKYLSSFATVTRNVLENSRMEFISINKEITLLENYLQLQKLRFKNRFEYEIKIDEHIDREAVIPPMLSQPFIENAIEHGFSGIENGGKISISYKHKNNELLMEITDNGVGMKEDLPQKKQNRSLALEITRERIALMNKKAKRKISFTITEAFPLHSERKGVKVSFRFPVDY